MERPTSRLRNSTVLILIGAAFLVGVCVPAIRSSAPVRSQPVVAPMAVPRTISSNYTENLPGLREQDEMIANLAEFVSPGVVHITAKSKSKGFDIMGNRLPETGGQGSGVIFRPDGYIVTNDHVVGGFDTVTVILNDGRELEGKVTRAQEVDIAVVKVDAKDLPSLPFGDSARVRPGQFSMAVGSPFGLENTVTIGHISALGRTNNIPDARVGIMRNYPGLLQTDTPINMGNSGGPLINVEGKVIGINTAIYSPNGLSAGIGFAIPSNTARLIAEKLIANGKLNRGALGVRPATLKPFKARQLGLEGGAIVSVQPDNGTPAGDSGIKKDDVIVRIGSVPIKSESDVRTAMLSHEPGEKVEVEIVRNGQRKVYALKLMDAAKLPQPPQERVRGQGGDLEIPDFDDLRKKLRERDESVPPLKSGKPRLGVMVENLTDAFRKQFSVPDRVRGVVVTSVAPESLAATLGLQVGDVIEELGIVKTTQAEKLRDAMQTYKWGDQTTLRFSRFGKNSAVTQTVDVTFE